jgi:hypothetical protein
MKHISQVNLGTRVYYHSHFFKATYTLKEMQQHQEKKKRYVWVRQRRKREEGRNMMNIDELPYQRK